MCVKTEETNGLELGGTGNEWLDEVVFEESKQREIQLLKFNGALKKKKNL